MSPIVRFYSGTGTDAVGRSLAQIQALDVARMEYFHDFIQWMFPLRQASAYNPNSPILTDEDVNAFRDRPELRDALRASFAAFLAFLGLEYDSVLNVVRKGPRYESRRRVFASPNHNWLRITRVLLCLKTLGLDVEAEAFFACLTSLFENGEGITAQTFAYWNDAARGMSR